MEGRVCMESCTPSSNIRESISGGIRATRAWIARIWDFRMRRVCIWASSSARLLSMSTTSDGGGRGSLSRKERMIRYCCFG